MPRYRITIEYDGTPYKGWQRQEGLPSVQQALEDAFRKFTQTDVTVFAAGRTDTGVHGLGQVIHVDLAREWEPQKVQEALNGLLKFASQPVAALNVERANDDFDARFSASQRHYRYVIVNRMAPLTVERDRAWWIRFPLDAEAMDDAAQLLVGHHDFTTFRSTECQAKSPIRTLDHLSVKRVSPERIEVTAKSRAFLHNQVRSIVGSLKYVGDGKWSKQDLQAALEAKDRKRCGPVAPSCGLYFLKVFYEH